MKGRSEEDGPALFEETRVRWAFSNGAARVLDEADRQARALGHGVVGTEHLVLALVSQGFGPRGVSLSTLRAQVAKIEGRGNSARYRLYNTPRLSTVLRLAAETAKRGRELEIRPSHLYDGLVIEGIGFGMGVLAQIGVDVARLTKAARAKWGLAPDDDAEDQHEWWESFFSHQTPP